MPSKPVQSRNYPTSFLWLSSAAAPARPVLCRKFPRTPTHVISANARSYLAAYVTLEISSKSHSLGGAEISSSALADVVSSLAAVIIGRDRPADRATAADAIADAIVSMGLATHDDFTLKDKITGDATKAIIHTRRKDESDGFTFYLMPVFPDHSWYIGTFVGLSDRLTTREFLAAFFEKLIADRDAIKLIEDHHDRVPDAHDIPSVVRVLLAYAEVKPCQVWMPGRRSSTGQRQNAVRIYMPPPSFQDDAIKAWKALIASASFTFVVDCRGRATPFKPETARTGKARPMECIDCLGLDHYRDECPSTTSPEFLAVHLNQAERDSVNVGTTLATIRDKDKMDPDGFKTVYRNTRPRNGPGPYKRPWGTHPRRAN
ncbi:hypothetical protein C8J57DRAFT_1724436 [Mycena rebaudengoi]|nr:hypothetical protein C8J57DRAFT_1724436 [Mycena rebaudengoi]